MYEERREKREERRNFARHKTKKRLELTELILT
jgi:hypothetical protein